MSILLNFEQDMQFLTLFGPESIIWSRAGLGSIVQSQTPWHNQIMLYHTSLICLQLKTNQFMDSINFVVNEN